MERSIGSMYYLGHNGINIPNDWNKGEVRSGGLSLNGCINYCKDLKAPYFSYYNDGNDGTDPQGGCNWGQINFGVRFYCVMYNFDAMAINRK